MTANLASPGARQRRPRAFRVTVTGARAGPLTNLRARAHLSRDLVNNDVHTTAIYTQVYYTSIYYIILYTCMHDYNNANTMPQPPPRSVLYNIMLRARLDTARPCLLVVAKQSTCAEISSWRRDDDVCSDRVFEVRTYLYGPLHRWCTRIVRRISVRSRRISPCKDVDTEISQKYSLAVNTRTLAGATHDCEPYAKPRVHAFGQDVCILAARCYYIFMC